MTEYCFAPGLSLKDVADAVDSLAPGLVVKKPVVAAGGAHASDARRLVFASASMLRLFGASDLDDLSARFFVTGGSGAARFAALVENFPMDAAPRLERLRFFLGPATLAITFLCRRIASPGGPPLFVAAALDGDEFVRRAVRDRPFSAPRPSAVPRHPPGSDAESAFSAAPDDVYGSEPATILSDPANEIPPRALMANDEPAAFGDEGRSPVPGAPRDWTRDDQDVFQAIALSLGGKLGAIISDDVIVEMGDPAPPAEGPSADPSRDVDQGHAILDVLPIGLLVFRGAVPIFANRFVLDLLGGSDLGLVFSSGRLDAVIDRLSSQTGAAEKLELRGEDEQAIPMLASVQSVRWGRQPAVLVSLRAWTEIEDPKRPTEALELFLETVTEAAVRLDTRGHILSINRRGELLLGYDKTRIGGELFFDLIAPDDRAPAEYGFGSLASNADPAVRDARCEVTLLARQGPIPVSLTLGRLAGGAPSAPKGRIARDMGFYALLRDMTPWKKIEHDLEEARRQAERASALKSQFLAKVSHEIRTPLNAILGFAEVIMEERFGPLGNERYKSYLKDIHASGSLVTSLVNDILDLSKIEAGKTDLAFVSVDANRIVAECVSIMQPQASRERVIMRLALSPRLPHVIVDERSLRQIALNLLSNAVKFNQPGGQVVVATALTDAGHAVLRIKDTGLGMSEAEIEIAMEPFRRLATARPRDGTGLGLPLTKALVEANRAVFSIKSKKHEGTLVEVAFPPPTGFVE